MRVEGKVAGKQRNPGSFCMSPGVLSRYRLIVATVTQPPTSSWCGNEQAPPFGAVADWWDLHESDLRERALEWIRRRFGSWAKDYVKLALVAVLVDIFAALDGKSVDFNGLAFIFACSSETLA